MVNNFARPAILLKPLYYWMVVYHYLMLGFNPSISTMFNISEK
jgi:hypothetical protein